MSTVLYPWVCPHSIDHILRILAFSHLQLNHSYFPIDLYSTLYLLPCTDFTNGPGLRDGFMEFVNIEEQVKSCVKESISTCDSSPICSQVWLSKNLCYELLHDTCLSHKTNFYQNFLVSSKLYLSMQTQLREHFMKLKLGILNIHY